MISNKELAKAILTALEEESRRDDPGLLVMEEVLAQHRAEPIQRDIPATNCMKMFLHCRKCVKERPRDVSPRDYQSLEIGYTELGFQVWCKRHDINVCHIDFQGFTHPANLNE